MQRTRRSIYIVVFVFIIIVLIAVSFILINSNKKDLTLSMYKDICSSQKYTITMEGNNSEYSYKVLIGQSGTDISFDMNTKYEEEEQHTTTLITDKKAYFIMHNEKEYSSLDSEDIEIDILIPQMKDVDEKSYQNGKEEIRGKTYYYEEYEDISTYLLFVDVNEEGKLKTRFYYDDGEIKYIKNIIEQDGKNIEELVKTTCIYNAEDYLFEIPEDYSEI